MHVPAHGARAARGFGRTELLLIAGALVFLSLMVLALYVTGKRRSGGLNEAAHPFDLATLEGGRVSLEQLEGQVVLVHFWATWCPPCVEEAPALEAMAQRMRGQPFTLVAISVDDDLDIVRRFFRGKLPAYVVALNPDASVARRYGTYKYPESYLISPTGRLAKRYVGAQDWSDPATAAAIRALMPAPAQSDSQAPAAGS